MSTDYAKEIARRALLAPQGDRKLLTGLIAYAFGELMTLCTVNELDALIEELRAELSEDA